MVLNAAFRLHWELRILTHAPLTHCKVDIGLLGRSKDRRHLTARLTRVGAGIDRTVLRD